MRIRTIAVVSNQGSFMFHVDKGRPEYVVLCFLYFITIISSHP